MLTDMQKVLILGAGMVVKPILTHLLKKNIQVTVATRTKSKADEIIGNHKNGKAISWTIDDRTGLEKMISEHNLTVSLLPYIHHLTVAGLCIKHKKNMVTTSYVKPEMKALDGEAKKAGIIILNECGLDPGIDHMSAMRIIHNVHERGGAILEFYSICGALPAPEAANNPFRYKFSWSPKGVVMAGNNDGRYLKHGKIVDIPTEDLFKNPFQVNFTGVGQLEVYPNRDSLAYREIYGIPEVRTLYRGTFRYPGWCETLDVMKQLALISNDKFDMTGMTYADMVRHQLKVGSRQSVVGSRQSAVGSLRQQVADHLGISVPAYALESLQWLGLFDETPMNRGVDSTFEVTSDLMIEKMALGPDERDMVALQHTFLAAYSDGHKEVIRSRMLDFGTITTDTSIARTVALPAAIGVEMILKGEINVKGVHIPVIPEIYNPLLDQLEIMGIKMVEEYGLPLSEMIS